MSRRFAGTKYVVMTAFLAVLVVAGTTGIASTAPSATPSSVGDARVQSTVVPQSVVDAARRDGVARVLVGVDAGTEASAIATAQTRVVQHLAGTGTRVVRRFDTIPFLALEVPSAALAMLASAPGLTAVEEDGVHAPALASSVPLVEGTAAWNAGYDGSGWSVAVIDSGVDRNNPWMAGKVVSEACFSRKSTCPNGSTTQTGTGAASPCTFATNECRHGTFVAEVAAGSASAAGFGTFYAGVAKGANVIAIQVFSPVDFSECFGVGCIGAYKSDLVAGLEHVFALRNTFQIAAVALSVADWAIATHNQVGCDKLNGAVKAAIDNLRAAGIATVAASGNNGFNVAINAPSCISSAISVGSTTRADKVAALSNSAQFLSLLAPGEVQVGLTTNTFFALSGTSMAAAHVAGAWAVIKQRSPSASVDEVLRALQRTGVPITDTKNSVTTPRIRILQALRHFNGITMSIGDGRVSEGNGGGREVTFPLSLSAPSPVPVTASYATADVTARGGVVSSGARMTIATEGPASPYPSTIAVGSGLGPIGKVQVTLDRFTHMSPGEVDLLLVGPTGAAVILMADAGSGGWPAENVTLTFDDAGPPVSRTARLTTGTYAPTNYAPAGEPTDTFASPAPSGPYGSALAVFAGTDPAGTWRLFVMDDDDPEEDIDASIAGWSITLITDRTDYVHAAGTVTFPAGTTSQNVHVPINGDDVREGAETFAVTLSEPLGATLADGQGLGTIQDDDFTDAVLAGITMKALHVFELRMAINEARTSKGLAPFPFSEPELAAQVTPIRAIHVSQMRTAIGEAYAAAGRTPPAFTDPELPGGFGPIKAVHILELRAAVANLL